MKQSTSKLKYFFECPFNEGEDFDDLDGIIERFKKREKPESQIVFITELHLIINTKGYLYAQKIIDKYGSRILDLEETEKMIKFLYNKLTDTPTDVKGIDFIKIFKGVYCPVCTPDIEKATKFSLIEKATIIQNNQEIFICKPCKLVWLSEDITKANAQDYKKFMRTLGLKGLWKELKDVDLL